jgi:hypothetical protein
MFHYRLCFRRDSKGPIVGSEAITARDDVDAVRLAGSRIGYELAELWCDKRKVKAFPPLDRDQSSLAFDAH